MGKYIALTFALCVAACVGQPNRTSLSNADYGIYMSQEECKRIAEAAILELLKDPQSARFSEGICLLGYSRSPSGNSLVFGYLQEGQVNAKNSFGGYAGKTKYQVFMRNGGILGKCIKNCRRKYWAVRG